MSDKPSRRSSSRLVSLAGRVAVVTGASRGIGRGVALGLAEAGALVYVTGRTSKEGESELSGSLASTVEAVAKLGGEARPVRCDHTRDADVEALFAQVREEQGRVDVLVNSVWGGYERMSENGEYTFMQPFWQQPHWRWDAMFSAGVRAAYVASAHAARLMVEAGSGLIVNISSFAGRNYQLNVAYGVSKAATDRLAADMAVELRPHGVSAVALYPGLVRTESVLAAGVFDLSNSESPHFIGRAVAALAADAHVLDRSGQTLVAAALAREYDFRDLDGSQPEPLTP